MQKQASKVTLCQQLDANFANSVNNSALSGADNAQSQSTRITPDNFIQRPLNLDQLR